MHRQQPAPGHSAGWPHKAGLGGAPTSPPTSPGQCPLSVPTFHLASESHGSLLPSLALGHIISHLDTSHLLTAVLPVSHYQQRPRAGVFCHIPLKPKIFQRLPFVNSSGHLRLCTYCPCTLSSLTSHYLPPACRPALPSYLQAIKPI